MTPAAIILGPIKLLIDKGTQELFKLEEVAVSDDFPTDPQPIPVTLEAPIFHLYGM